VLLLAANGVISDPGHRMTFDHLGILVTDLLAGRALIGPTFGISQWTREYEDPLQDVFAQFGRDASGICYEIVAPRSDKSPVQRSLSSKVNTINHVAYLVERIELEQARLAGEGFIAIGQPKSGIAFDQQPIQFFVSSTRLLIELIEAPHHLHDFCHSYQYNRDAEH